MRKALVEILPKKYGLCTWHLMQNAIKHLDNLMKGESHILIMKFMYGYEEEENLKNVGEPSLKL